MTVDVMFSKTKALWDKRVEWQMKPGVNLFQVLMHILCEGLAKHTGSIRIWTRNGLGKEVNNISYRNQNSNKLLFAAQGKQSFS